MNEPLRMLDSGIHAASGLGVFPAEWPLSKPDMQPAPEGVDTYLTDNPEAL
jgi:hypothetical protein